jgi:hypothetical protein
LPSQHDPPTFAATLQGMSTVDDCAEGTVQMPAPGIADLGTHSSAPQLAPVRIEQLA